MNISISVIHTCHRSSIFCPKPDYNVLSGRALINKHHAQSSTWSGLYSINIIENHLLFKMVFNKLKNVKIRQ